MALSLALFAVVVVLAAELASSASGQRDQTRRRNSCASWHSLPQSLIFVLTIVKPEALYIYASLFLRHHP
jgi:hypothetical protein